MQDKWNLFQKFLIAENATIEITDFLINAAIAVILAFILERSYIKCGNGLSNRKLFALNFILLTFTTMLIISIVKSSLALSLGLVGALSIVRFRAAIKEPEELTYLFFTIAIGLGLGANQRIIVLVAFGILLLVVWLRYFLAKKTRNQNLMFTVSSNSPATIRLNNIMDIVRENFDSAELKRFDENAKLIEASFIVETNKTEKLQICTEQLQKLSDNVKVTFLDNK